MKLFENIKTEDESTFKILGFPVYRQTKDYMTTERLQSFLGGLVTTYKINDIYDYHIEKDIKILGKSIIKRIEDGATKTWYCANIPYKKLNLVDVFKKAYLKFIDEKYDDVYVLNANSGEIYLFLTYVLDTYIKKNNSKNPLLIATKKYHLEMAKMICPDVPCIFLKKIKHGIKGDCFKIDKHRFFMAFANDHFTKVEYDIKNNPLGTKHYFWSILERFGISNDELSIRKINVPQESIASMNEKINNIGLRLNNFVFIAPEAKSCKLTDDQFWKDMIIKYQNEGYDVFVNLVEDIVDLSGVEYKTCELSYSEAFALAQKAKKIVSLRSGFTEFLLQTNVPMDVIYTRFKKRHYFRDMQVEHVMTGFGIKQIPFVNMAKVKEINFYELDTNNYSRI